MFARYVPVVLVVLPGCGPSPEQQACAAFLEAAEACWTRSGLDYDGDPPGVCASYVGDDLRTVDQYACMTEAYERGDCLTADSRRDVFAAMADCREGP